MKSLGFHLAVALLTFIIGMTATSVWVVLRLPSEPGIKPLPLSLEIRHPSPIENAPGAVTDSPIREVDFANFTYPSGVVGEKGGFKLQQGELLPKKRTQYGIPLDMWLTLATVVYGDLTGDGNEEAIVDLGWITGGSAIPDLVYIYTLRNGRPKLLWAFVTGDRADGGYKNVYAENGKLVIELQGKDKIIGKNLYADDGTNQGDCCPTFYTRTRYEWRRNGFRQKGKAEVFRLDR